MAFFPLCSAPPVSTRITAPLPCSTATRLAAKSTCHSLPYCRIWNTRATNAGTGHHSGLYSISWISHTNRITSPVGKACYGQHCAVCSLVAQGHTRRERTFALALSCYENRSWQYCEGRTPSATVLVPVEQPGSRDSYVQAIVVSPFMVELFTARVVTGRRACHARFHVSPHGSSPRTPR
jgi:hypothetical protein